MQDCCLHGASTEGQICPTRRHGEMKHQVNQYHIKKGLKAKKGMCFHDQMLMYWQHRRWYKWRGILRPNVEHIYHYVNKFSLQTNLSKGFVLGVYDCNEKKYYSYINLRNAW